MEISKEQKRYTFAPEASRGKHWNLEESYVIFTKIIVLQPFVLWEKPLRNFGGCATMGCPRLKQQQNVGNLTRATTCSLTNNGIQQRVIRRKGAVQFLHHLKWMQSPAQNLKSIRSSRQWQSSSCYEILTCLIQHWLRNWRQPKRKTFSLYLSYELWEFGKVLKGAFPFHPHRIRENARKSSL